MNAREALAEAERRLAAAGVETPRVDAEWLVAHVLGTTRSGLAARGDDEVDGLEPLLATDLELVVEPAGGPWSRKPRTRAAREPAWREASTTSTTGRSSRAATAAELPSLLGPRPSNRPITPSTSTRSAWPPCQL